MRFERLPEILPWLGAAAAVSFLFCLAVRKAAVRFGAMDRPSGGRKIHHLPIPLWGGLGIGLALLLILLVRTPLNLQLSGFAVSLLILMIGGALDDRYDLPPVAQFLFPLAACAVAVLTGTNIVHITNWQGGAPIELGWWGSALAFAWLLTVTYAMKFMDGLDGLVTGQTVIGSCLIGLLALTTTYFQPEVALLAAIVAGAFLGFLPINFQPAKQFLGESGATMAGFTLGFLSILGGAKLATGLMALGLPLMDAALVVAGRIIRGAPPWKGDNTHLHFKLIRAGLSQRQAVLLIWSVSAAVGLAALTLQSIGKALLVLGLLVLLLALSAWAEWKAKRSAVV